MAETTSARPIPAFIMEKRDEIAALCREYGVARLEVFGSVMTDEFDPDKSDVDLLVEFREDTELGPWLSSYARLVDALAALLDRPVALRMEAAPGYRNPCLMRLIDTTAASLFHEA